MNTFLTGNKVGVALLFDAIPESEQQEFQAIGDRWEYDYWRIGDKVNEWKEKVRDQYLPVTDEHVYRFMAYLLGDRIRARTVRYYADVARFYSGVRFQTRDDYDVLTFTHFAIASRGESWLILLDACVEYMHFHGGRRPTVGWLEKLLGQPTSQPEPPNEWRDGDILALANSDDAMAYDVMGMGTINPAVLASFQSAVQRLVANLHRFPISDEARQRIQAASETLLDELSKALS